NALPSANRAVDPKDTPWSPDGALKVVASLTSGGAIEPPKDILDIARSFVSSAIEPAVKDWWARRVNSLDQLEIISATRGLNAEEMSLKERLLKQISDAANDPNSLAINGPAYIAPARPLTAAEFKQFLAQAFPSKKKSARSSQAPIDHKSASSASADVPTTESPVPIATPGPVAIEQKSPVLGSQAATSSPPLDPLSIKFSGSPPASPTASSTASSTSSSTSSPTTSPTASPTTKPIPLASLSSVLSARGTRLHRISRSCSTQRCYRQTQILTVSDCVSELDESTIPARIHR